MKRVEELDFTRVIAMLFVIVIHVTRAFIYNESRFTLFGMNLAFFLNQTARFAVPMFVLLSGLSLSLSNTQDSYGTFLKKRFQKLGIPYLFWFLLYFLHNIRTNGTALRSLTCGDVLQSFLMGQAAPHLYFVAVIFQFYLLFPLLRKWVNTSPGGAVLVSFLVTYCIQKCYFFKSCGFDWIPPWIKPCLWILFPTWIFYFVTGMALKRLLPQLQKLAARCAPSILMGTAVFLLFYTKEAQVTDSIESIKTGLDLYVPLVLLSCFALWHFIGNWTWVRSLTRFLADRSMTIYFCHVLILQSLCRFSIFQGGILHMLLLLVLVFLLAVCVASLLQKLPALFQRRPACT